MTTQIASILHVLERGPATAETIAEATNIPLSRVRVRMAELRELGAVHEYTRVVRPRVRGRRPMIYTLDPPR